MLELGDETERCHRSLGRKVANEGIDLLWAIGPSAHLIAAEARALGMSESAVCAHATLEDALDSPAFEPRSGDTWIFRGSRGMQLERLCEQVGTAARLADPAHGAISRGPRA